MFYHGWNAYTQNAFPDDELRPLTCEGLSKDETDPTNIGINDVLGGYSVTLIDSLDMFPILGDQEGFERNVERVKKYVSFNISSTVQVFETTIRGIGGLLSAHLYASVPRLGHQIPDYDGHLLALAYDLAERLLPSFETDSGIPYPRINLKHGLAGAKVTAQNDPNDITETCTSGAGSLVLEFGLLSRLTGDPRFEQAAKRAFFAIWARRSDLNLVAMAIDSATGQWLSPMTGNGASIDSYYEYALKYSVLFGSKEFLNVYNKLNRGLMANSFDGWMFRNINFQKGNQVAYWIDSLAAFYPSIMALAGDLTNAVRVHLTYYKIWNTFSALPERWNIFPNSPKIEFRTDDAVNLEWYPLRPEFIESNYYIYRATKDPMFLQMGKSAMEDLKTRNKVKCGFAGTQDVRTGKLSNRMESFFLSETVKYLYLLFEGDHALNTEFSNFVFSTEAHPFWFDQDVMDHAAAQTFSNLEHIWGPKTHEYEQNIHQGKPKSENNREFVQFSDKKLSSEQTQIIQEYLNEEAKPWYKRLSVSVVWGDFRSKYSKKNHKSLIGPSFRRVVYYLKRISNKISRVIYPKAHTMVKRRKPSKNTKKDIKTELFMPKTVHADISKQKYQNKPKPIVHDYNKTTSLYDPKNVKFHFSHQCEVWRPERNLYSQTLEKDSQLLMSSGLYSHISTWPEFYELDSLYMFRRPRYLQNYQGWDTRNNFNKRYTLPESFCSVPPVMNKKKKDEKPSEAEKLEMFFLTPEGGKRGEILSRHENGNIEGTSLNGLRITIRRAKNNEKDSKFQTATKLDNEQARYDKNKQLEYDEKDERYAICKDPDVQCDFVDERVCEQHAEYCNNFDDFEQLFQNNQTAYTNTEGEKVQDGPLEYNIEIADGVRIPKLLLLRDIWVSGDGTGLVHITPDGKMKVDNYILGNIRILRHNAANKQ